MGDGRVDVRNRFVIAARGCTANAMRTCLQSEVGLGGGMICRTATNPLPRYSPAMACEIDKTMNPTFRRCTSEAGADRDAIGNHEGTAQCLSR